MAKPKMAMIPSTVGGSVYSVLPSNGDGDFNFTRASAATRINAQGLIETVAVGDNRLNYPLLDGTVQTCPHLLLEGQRTNLFTYSEDFSNAAWTKNNVTITANSTASPDGNLTADLVVADLVNGEHRILRNIIATSPFNFSIYFKSSGNPFAFIQILDGTVNSYIYFDTINLTTGIQNSGGGSPVFVPKIESLSNNWFRISVSVSNTNSSTSIRFGLANGIVSGSNIFTGNNIDGAYFWGAQLEQGSYPTSYIVSNSGSATTRLAETCNNAGNSDIIPSDEGVFYAEIAAFVDFDSSYRFISLKSTTDTFNDRVEIGFFQDKIWAQVSSDGVNNLNYSTSTSNLSQFKKVALRYSNTNGCAFYVDGVQLKTGTNTTFVSGDFDALEFENLFGGNNFRGKTKMVAVFPYLSNDELECLTGEGYASFEALAAAYNYTTI
jgi:hypothetical protein